MPIAPIVIVHHPQNDEAASGLEVRLQAAGYATWRSADVLVGQMLATALSAQLELGGPVVLCLSGHALVTGVPFIVTSALLRRQADRPQLILPVQLERCYIDHLLLQLGHPRVVDCIDSIELGVDQLLSTLRRVYPLPQAGAGTSIAVPPSTFLPLEAQIDAYLKATREEHHLMPVAGFETEVKIPVTLNTVYVSLRARVHRVLTDGLYRWGSHLEEVGGKIGEAAAVTGVAAPPVANVTTAPAAKESTVSPARKGVSTPPVGKVATASHVARGTRARPAENRPDIAPRELGAEHQTRSGTGTGTEADLSVHLEPSVHDDLLGAAPGPGDAHEIDGEEALEDHSVRLEEAFQVARQRFKLRGLVVVGDPGSGKTTLLKRLLVQCIDGGSEALGLPGGLVPILLPLRYLRDPARGVDAFIQEHLETNPHLKLSPGFGEALLARGRLLLLFDGLDEVADEDTRVEVRRWIERAHTARPDCYFAVTSRFAGYQGKARFDGRFLELDVQPFDDDQARRFIHQWYETVEVGLRGDTQHARAQAQQQSERLWNGLTLEEFRSRRLRSLMGNPLLLTILCLVHRVRGSLPKRRVPLYRECVNVLLQHWQQAKELRLEVEGEQARQALQPVAWWMHQEEGRTRATTAELAPVLEQPLERLKVRLTAAQFLATIRDRSGLLVGWDVDSFGFMHLSFQEYLVALEAWSEDRLEAVAARFGESWWTEVTLLLLAIPEKPVFERFMRCLLQTDRFVRQGELVGLCLEESFEVSPTPFLEVLDAAPRGPWERDYAALLALRHPLLKDSRDPRIVETCRRLTTSPHAPVRDLARELLAVRGIHVATGVKVATMWVRATTDLTAGDVWVHRATGLEFVYVPAGSFWMGSEQGNVDEKPVHKVIFARGFWIGKYPVTNKQYELFVKATNHEEPPRWSDKRWSAPEQPVIAVTWEDARTFCRWASQEMQREQEFPPDGSDSILLPSEAQWEYAARGPDGKMYPWGNCEPSPALANYRASHLERTTLVGQYPQGASWVGALDMTGNVGEWCADVWHGDYYGAPVNGSPWVSGGDQERRVCRGGRWDVGPTRLRTAFRDWRHPKDWYVDQGFRVVLTVTPPEGRISI